MKLMDYINNDDNIKIRMPFMGTNGLRLLGYTMDEVYNSPEKQLELAIIMDEAFDLDFVGAMDDGNIFCETLGVPMKRYDFDFPMVIEHPIDSSEALSRLKVPNPFKDGRMPTNLKSLELIAKHFEKPVEISIQGPFTLAVQLGGAQKVLRSIIKDPKFLDDLLDFTTNTVLEYAKAVESVGVKYISIAEPSTIMISPKRYEHLAAKNLRRIYSNLNCWKAIHICGDTTEILDFMINFGVDAISLDQIMDLSEVAKIIPKDIAIIGNFDPIELAKMKSEEVVKETRRLMDSMKSCSNYIPSFGCTSLNNTPIENLKVFCSTVRNNNY